MKITTDILEKMGFELYDVEPDTETDHIFEAYRVWKTLFVYYTICQNPEGDWSFGISRQMRNPTKSIEIDSDHFTLANIATIDQLQNIFKALEGKELTLKC